MNALEPYLLHPIAVHFTVGLLIFATFLYLLALVRKQAAGARAAADWSLGAGLVAILVTAGLGFLAYYTVAHDGPSHAAMTDHRNWAIGTLAVFLALGVWRWRWRSGPAGALFVTGMIAGGVLLGVTGLKGGHLVFEYGMGVERLPSAEGGDGHDHDHGGPEDAGGGQAHSSGHAHDDGAGAHPHGEATAPASRPAEDGSPEAAADAFHAALASGDEAAVRSLLAEDVLILEGGGAEQSLEEYASGHMGADMAFLSAVESRTLSRSSGVQSESAWVATETALEGRFRDQDVAVKSQETLVMERAGESWRITHVHWSNGPLHAADGAAGGAGASEEASHTHEDGADDHEH